MTTSIQSVKPEINIGRGSVQLNFTGRSNRIQIPRRSNNFSITQGQNNTVVVSRDEESSLNQIQAASNNLVITPGNNSIDIEKILHDATFVKNVLEPTYQKGINRITVSLGQSIRGRTEEFSVEFYATCSLDEEVGHAVYIYSTSVDNSYVVRKVDITDTSKMPAIGVIKEKFSVTECRITVCGLLKNIFSGKTPQNMLYVGLDSYLVEAEDLPNPVLTPHWAQIIGQVASDHHAIIQINPTPCWRIG